MIPASYLFKNLYERRWVDTEPDSIPTTGPEPRFVDRFVHRIPAVSATLPAGRVGRHSHG